MDKAHNFKLHLYFHGFLFHLIVSNNNTYNLQGVPVNNDKKTTSTRENSHGRPRPSLSGRSPTDTTKVDGTTTCETRKRHVGLWILSAILRYTIWLNICRFIAESIVAYWFQFLYLFLFTSVNIFKTDQKHWAFWSVCWLTKYVWHKRHTNTQESYTHVVDTPTIR